MVKLSVIESNGIKTERVAGAAFQSLVFDKTSGCNDAITLRLGDSREIVCEIIDPIRITLHPSGASGDFNPLQIAAENGVFIITFHPALHAQMLRDLKTN